MKIPTFQVVFRTFKQKNSVIFVDCNSLRKQGVCLYKRHFCFAKMLVGNSQTLCDLHRTAAGCAFLPNAFLMEFMIQWYIRRTQTHLGLHQFSGHIRQLLAKTFAVNAIVFC